MKKQAVVLKHNKPRPRVAHRGIAALRGFSKLTKNVIRSSSYGHSTPCLKISCKSVQPLSPNLANKENKQTKKQTNKKSIENNTPTPILSGTG